MTQAFQRLHLFALKHINVCTCIFHANWQSFNKTPKQHSVFVPRKIKSLNLKCNWQKYWSKSFTTKHWKHSLCTWNIKICKLTFTKLYRYVQIDCLCFSYKFHLCLTVRLLFLLNVDVSVCFVVFFYFFTVLYCLDFI